MIFISVNNFQKIVGNFKPLRPKHEIKVPKKERKAYQEKKTPNWFLINKEKRKKKTALFLSKARMGESVRLKLKFDKFQKKWSSKEAFLKRKVKIDESYFNIWRYKTNRFKYLQKDIEWTKETWFAIDRGMVYTPFINKLNYIKFNLIDLHIFFSYLVSGFIKNGKKECLIIKFSKAVKLLNKKYKFRISLFIFLLYLVLKLRPYMVIKNYFYRNTTFIVPSEIYYNKKKAYKIIVVLIRKCINKRKERTLILKIMSEFYDFFNSKGFLHDELYEYISLIDKASYNVKHLKHYKKLKKISKLDNSDEYKEFYKIL